MSWNFLSYSLSIDLTSYGKGEGIKVHQDKSICNGDTCNTCRIEIPNHYGTHIDFPKHFSDSGKDIDSYSANCFQSSQIQLIDLSTKFNDLKDKVLIPDDLAKMDFSKDAEILIFNFGFWKIRYSDDYIFSNPGFSPECAAFLKKKCPSLRILIMDNISLNPWKNKPLGREAHRAFLLENDILIVEDADLSSLNKKTEVFEIIIAPLRFKSADGTPVTIMGRTS